MLEYSDPKLEKNGQYTIVFYNVSNNPVELYEAQKIFKECLGIYARSRDVFYSRAPQNLTFYSDNSGIRQLSIPDDSHELDY